MKKYLCCSAAIILHLLSFAQDDSLRVNLSDSLRSPDTLAEKRPVVNTGVNHQEIYKLKPSVDIPVFAVGAGWSAYAFTKIYSKERSTEEQILSLKRSFLVSLPVRKSTGRAIDP